MKQAPTCACPESCENHVIQPYGGNPPCPCCCWPRHLWSQHECVSCHPMMQETPLVYWDDWCSDSQNWNESLWLRMSKNHSKPWICCIRWTHVHRIFVSMVCDHVTLKSYAQLVTSDKVLYTCGCQFLTQDPWSPQRQLHRIDLDHSLPTESHEDMWHSFPSTSSRALELVLMDQIRLNYIHEVWNR